MISFIDPPFTCRIISLTISLSSYTLSFLKLSYINHLHHLRQVCDALRREKLYAHPKKCYFFTTEVSFVRFLVSAQGVSADPEKVRAITSWPRPSTIHDIRSFIGLATFYRRFVQNFSSVMAPINDYLKLETF